MTDIIDPKSTSFREIKKQLEAYVQSKPNYSAWEDFYTQSAGQTILELVAALGAFNQYNNLASRRESYLEYSNLASSARAIGNSRGYNSDRGSNTILQLTFTPPANTTYNYLEVVGSFGEFDLISLENKTVTSGVSSTLSVTIGSIEEQEVTAQSSDLAVFRFTNADVSNHVEFSVNAVVVDYSTRYLDLAEGKWVLLTNGYGAVNAYCLNEEDPGNIGFTVTGQPIYDTSDVLKIKYAKLVSESGLSFDSLSEDVVFFDVGPSAIEVSNSLSGPESADSIRINAPLFYETQFVIRGRNDYEKIAKTLNERLLDVRGRDYSPTVVELTYLTEEQTPLIETDVVKELTEFRDELLSYRVLGVQPAIITPSIRSNLAINVDIKLVGVVSEDFTPIIEKAVEPWNLKFSGELDFSDVEFYIEENSDLVKTVRAYPSSEAWQADHDYERITFVHPTTGIDCDIVYVPNAPTSQSGSTEPSWPTLASFTEDTLQQGGPYLVNDLNNGIKRLSVYVFEQGLESTVYGTDDGNGIITGPNISGTVDYVTGEIDITSSHTGNITVKYENDVRVEDGGVVWELIRDERCDVPEWQADTDYASGDVVKPTGLCTSIYSFRYIQPLRKSSATEPTWPTVVGDTIIDEGIVWRAATAVGSHDLWQATTTYGVGDIIEPASTPGLMMVAVSYTYQSGSSEPTWPTTIDDTVVDGGITWRAVSTQSLVLELLWNEYLEVTSTVSVTVNRKAIGA